MYLFDFFKPQWKHSSKRTRIKYACKTENISILEKMALNDIDLEVRITAVKRIRNPIFLRNIALHDSNSEMRQIAYQLLEKKDELKQLFDFYSISQEENRSLALRKISNVEFINSIAINDISQIVRIEALKKVKDHIILEKIARFDKNISVRIAAFKALGYNKGEKEISYLESQLQCDNCSEIYDFHKDSTIVTDEMVSSQFLANGIGFMMPSILRNPDLIAKSKRGNIGVPAEVKRHFKKGLANIRSWRCQNCSSVFEYPQLFVNYWKKTKLRE